MIEEIGIDNIIYFCPQEQKVSSEDSSVEFSELNNSDITCKFCNDDMERVTLALKVSRLTYKIHTSYSPSSRSVL